MSIPTFPGDDPTARALDWTDVYTPRMNRKGELV
jgi:hypothetical protein